MDINIDKYIKDCFFSQNEYVGTIIEVGGGHPVHLSMSKLFKEIGWKVLIIEPNPELVKLHKDVGNKVFDVVCLDFDNDEVEFTIVKKNNSSLSCSSVKPKKSYLKVAGYDIDKDVEYQTIKVKQITLDTLIKENNIKKIDILTIDVEGYEIEVMRGLTLLKPNVIVLENLFDDVIYHNYMSDIGYKLYKKMGENHIYKLL